MFAHTAAKRRIANVAAGSVTLHPERGALHPRSCLDVTSLMLSAYIFARLFPICPTSRRPKSHFWTCAPWARRLPCAPLGGGRGEVLRQTSSALTFNFAAKRGKTAAQENDLAAKQSSAATRNIALCLLSHFRMAVMSCVPSSVTAKCRGQIKFDCHCSIPRHFQSAVMSFSNGCYVVCHLSKRKRKRQFPLTTGKAFSFFSFA